LRARNRARFQDGKALKAEGAGHRFGPLTNRFAAPGGCIAGGGMERTAARYLR